MNNQNQELLDIRRTESLEDIKAMLEKLTAFIDRETQRTEYHWDNLGSLTHVVDLLQDAFEFVVEDGD